MKNDIVLCKLLGIQRIKETDFKSQTKNVYYMAYTPLRISTIKPEREINFDLFIFYKEQYIKYLDKGNSIESEKYKKLRKQKIAKFFIDESDEVNYQSFLDSLLNESLESDDIPVDEKVNLVEGACNTAVERIHDDPGSETSYNLAKMAASNLRKVIQKNPEALKKIFGKKADDSELVIKHSLNVSALATKLAEKMKLSEDEMDIIAAAGLIHDVGITQLEEAEKIFMKPKAGFEPDDIRNYNIHVKDGLKILKDKPFVNQEILELVENHEEVLAGTGPNKKSKLSPSEEILSLVNRYDKKCITENMEPKDVIKNMMIDELGNYDLKSLQIFKEVLQAEGLLDDIPTEE